MHPAHQARCTITTINSENQMLYYISCPNEGCKFKKVLQRDDGTWFCERCNQVYSSEEGLVPRYVLTLNVADFSAMAWCNMFNEVGQILLKVDAATIKALRENNDLAFEHLFLSCCYQEWIMKLKSNVDYYKDEARMKSTILWMEPVDYVHESKNLLNKISQYFTSS
eukprot:TRINITY_DN5945_c0_g1_i2.p1 TRINITY_DN5945_c0_g1~~TRINITY_DN5945_c0_g1_i2.p1  ORF type:complete len:167 (+),score=36.72 TRINITY_DN5945_c0_g1_i2:1039-1539(+)